MMKEVKSPLTGKTNVRLEYTLPAERIIEQYWKGYQIDVRPFFTGLAQVEVYKCLDTDYAFYFPGNLGGDGRFYEQLQAQAWYYPRWKWDFEVAASLIGPGDSVLEVGCGDGQFLEYLKQQNIAGAGLELSEKAVQAGRNKGLDVYPDTIQDFARTHGGAFDVVCCFQVLEHITDVRSFLQASVDVLKPGGKLIVCVPNNDGFLKYDQGNLFNQPPHHMGLWTTASLANLSRVFNLSLAKVYYEPLYRSDRSWARTVFTGAFYTLHWRLGALVKALPDAVVGTTIKLLGKQLKGHSVLAVYTKK
jgi:2-polyprenyl-3-methyl-5-hydroxy-6-metoxy-1,4-benzoquinol methylase